MEISTEKRTLVSVRKSLADIKAGRYKDYKDVKQFRKEFELRLE